MGLSDDPELQPLLCVLFLSMYLVTVLGNLLIILAIIADPHLHTPMYFFLFNLSLADISLISTTVPKVIVNIQTYSRVISYSSCLTQMSIFIFSACMDSMLLTVMAYDRFVAICHPLHYMVIMNQHTCCFSVLVSFFVSFLDSQLHNLIVLQVACFKDVEISHFFCNPSEVLKLACSDTLINNIIMYFFGTIYGFCPISGIFFSYYKIISSVLRVPSSGGRYKAFSTCGSHLAVVCLFYGTGLGVYLTSAISQSPRKYTAASVMYTVVTPMLNPFIYSLRNKDIKSALCRLLSKAWRVALVQLRDSDRGYSLVCPKGSTVCSALVAVAQVETSDRELKHHTWRVGELKFIMPVGPEELPLQALSPKQSGYRLQAGGQSPLLPVVIGPDWGLDPGPYIILWPFLVSWSVPPMSPVGAWPSGELECRYKREPRKSSGGMPPCLCGSSSSLPSQATGPATQVAGMVGI
ncbi:olfactory receptor 7E24-like [Dama dama]|uniref:olfactory receptor 7E24-like n=1 Tax=Dama dama TaxID=30532 RepID=UPI002A370C81|nr:olfactory receptor 7E24-like [Dama dama]